MKRPAFSIALALLAGGIAGRVLLIPEWLAWVVGALLFFAAAQAFIRAYYPTGGEAARNPPAQSHPSNESSPDERPPESAPLPARAFGNLRACSLLLTVFFFLGVLQQNALVRRERAAADEAALLAGAGPQWFRGTLDAEPLVTQAGNRVTLALRDVTWLGPTSGTLTAKTARSAAKTAKERSFAEKPRVLPPPPRHLSGGVLLYLNRDAAAAMLKQLPFQGQGVRFAAALSEPPPAAHIGLFDYRAYLREHGVCAMASAWRPGTVLRAPEADHRAEAAFYSFLMQWRRQTMRFLETLGPPERTGLMQAVLLGDMSGVTVAQRDAYAKAGVAHLLAVSGTHTSLIALLVFMACRLARVSGRMSAWIMIVTVLSYSLLTGFQPPVSRSAFMVILLTLPQLMRRTVESLTVFSLAAAVTLLFDPAAFLKPDFQLSYLCVFGMITLAPPLMELVACEAGPDASCSLASLRALGRHLLLPLAQTAAAQLMVLPVLAVLFHCFPLVGFVSNMILVPYFGLYLGAVGAVALLGTFNPALGLAFGPALCGLSAAFDAMAEFFAAVPGGNMPLLSFPWWLIGAYYALLLSGPHLWMRRYPGALEERRGGLLPRLAAIAALLAWWPLLERLPALRGEPVAPFGMTVLDVGQGDSIALQGTDNQVIVIDTGRPQAARVILDFLRARGVEEIGALVLTHADNDHSGGAAELLQRLPARLLVLGADDGRPPEHETMRAVLRSALQRGVPITHVARGDALCTPGLRLDVLNPPPGRSKAAPGGEPPKLTRKNRDTETNNRSVVLRAEYGGARFLLMGDAGLDVERELIGLIGPEGLRADVLKAGHHGSATASGEEFLKAAHPGVTVFSAGASNRFGHPDPAVVERARLTGSQTLTTAEMGSVDVRTNGRRLWLRVSRGEAPE